MIALDLSPCCGQPTGVGRYAGDLALGLAAAGAPAAGTWQGHHGDLPATLRAACAGGGRYDLLGGRLGLRLRLPGLLRRLGSVRWHATTTIGVPGPGWRGAVSATVHDLWPLAQPDAVAPRHRRLFRRLLAAVLARADRLIAPSAHTADALRRHGWSGPLAVVPHGVDASGPPPSRPAAAPAEPYLLTIGALEPRKGWDLLAAARPPGPWIHLGPARHDPGGMQARTMDAAGCRRLGWVDEAERLAWLAHAAVLAIPSRDEGFGYPALEAMARGVPVCALRSGSLPEVGGDAVRWSTPETLGEDLRQLLRDTAARGQLAEAGRRRAAGFTIAAMVAGHRAVWGDA